MARNLKKKALYEVIGKAVFRQPYSKRVEQLRSKEAHSEPLTTEGSTAPMSDRVSGWPKRPSVVQFNTGRIDISISYQIAIALLLGVVLLFLVVFRLGQSNSASADLDGKIPEGARSGTALIAETPSPAVKAPQDTVPAEPTESRGNNRIVLKEYSNVADLAQAKKYFEQFDIETEIKQIGRTYWLRTVDKYENPGREGSDGYNALKRIKQVGANYKAPAGYETFGRKPFQDAYGKRFDD